MKMNEQQLTIDPIFEAFKEFYKSEAKIIIDENYDGWEITKTISQIKWDCFKHGWMLHNTLTQSVKGENQDE